MKLLLDSHTLIWWVDHHDLVGEGAKSAILEEGSELYVSAGSVLEIAIKVGKGKLRLSAPFREWTENAISRMDAKIVPISVEHAGVQSELPHHHGDPFDRLLVAQSAAENLTLVSKDHRLDVYGIPRIW